jgi:hypothetical protein
MAEEMLDMLANPFEDSGPDKYTRFLYAQQQAHSYVLFGLSKKMDELEEKIKKHERAHNVASAEVMRMSSTEKEGTLS